MEVADMLILKKIPVQAEVRQMITEIYSKQYRTYVIISPEVFALGVSTLKRLYDALFDLNDKLIYEPNWPISSLIYIPNGLVRLEHDYFESTWKRVSDPQTQVTDNHVVT
ncbi:MAG: hypothetical protein ACI92I_000985, partial [Acidimicrobiales bacterium]